MQNLEKKRLTTKICENEWFLVLILFQENVRYIHIKKSKRIVVCSSYCSVVVVIVVQFVMCGLLLEVVAGGSVMCGIVMEVCCYNSLVNYLIKWGYCSVIVLCCCIV